MILTPVNYDSYFKRSSDFDEIDQAYRLGAAEKAAREAAAQKQAESNRFIDFISRTDNPSLAERIAFAESIQTPEVKKSVTKAFAQMSKEQRTNTIGQAAQMYYAMSSQDNEAVDSLFDRLASENPESQDILLAQKEAYKKNPEAMIAGVVSILSTDASGRKALDEIGKRRDEQSKAEKRKADIEAAQITPEMRNTQAWINATPEQREQMAAYYKSKKPDAPTNQFYNPADTAAAKVVAGAVKDEAEKIKESANTSVKRISTIERLRAAIPDAIVGQGQQLRFGVAKLAYGLGLTNDQSIKATADIVQGVASLAVEARGLLAGSGAITQSEQDLLSRAESADATFTKPELEQLMDTFEKAARIQYDQSTSRLAEIGQNEAYEPMLGGVAKIPPPKKKTIKTSSGRTLERQ